MRASTADLTEGQRQRLEGLVGLYASVEVALGAAGRLVDHGRLIADTATARAWVRCGLARAEQAGRAWRLVPTAACRQLVRRARREAHTGQKAGFS